MKKIDLHIKDIFKTVSTEQLHKYQPTITKCHDAILNKTGKGSDFLGWVDLPTSIDKRLLVDIDNTANKLRAHSEVFVVIGIGGSYLGARAVIDALKHHFDFMRPHEVNKKPVIVYAGHNISEDYLADLLDVLDNKDYSLTVISKSGTTTEPAIAFRILKTHLENKYGEGAKDRIIAITDGEKGALKQLSINKGYKSYIVPDDVGGRYSVLTPVGLLPIAVAGFDIQKLVEGANDMRVFLHSSPSIDSNPAAMYAAARNALYESGKHLEIMVSYLPNLYYLTEWWKQLYGESEGKEGKGIFPAGVVNTTDLHSMGQYIQEGERKIFETVLSVDQVQRERTIPFDNDDLDSLNYISGKNIHYVNQMAEAGTTIAHVDGDVPNIRISIPEINEYYLGQLIYFFEFACALSGYALGINPFDQPGVEAYKKNMFALLGKKGFEKETEAIRKRL
ncbi:MAG: glucose-6-phosphate isomerase [Bacteroidetes bacterium 4484_276]|nr:MAG: glucose-6-phosphate isomerase [Bacteroidetes bacterium 4484_276]